MTNRIELKCDGSGWTATYTGDHEAETVRLFGTNTIPTAFTAQCPADVVVRHIRKMNPGVMVNIYTPKMPDTAPGHPIHCTARQHVQA